jgi:probable metal-binding protein
MTAEELITFLEARGKFIQESEGFRTEPDRMCKD